MKSAPFQWQLICRRVRLHAARTDRLLSVVRIAEEIFVLPSRLLAVPTVTWLIRSAHAARCSYSSTAVPRYHDDGHGIKMTKKGFSESRPVAITSLVAAQTVAPVFAYAQPSGGPFDRTRQK